MAGKSIIELLQRYLQVLQEEGIIIEKAFLFGSYMWETETLESDIDLMLVSKQFDTSNDLLFGKVWALTKKVNSKIEPYIVGASKFETDDVSPIIQIVKKEGFEIAC
ncbi:MAG: nucleotidyltransferase domain-containing protein [Draconibacterium sp.]|nr:nucleotidyltransferase domain-containing protein [Draconibacterium sp.]